MHVRPSVLDRHRMGRGGAPGFASADHGRRNRMLAPVEVRSRIRHPIFEFMGVRYYRTRNGYYKAMPNGELLHRAVWRHHNGAIPPGHEIHHLDDNKANNDPSNLECLLKAAHCSMHMRRPERTAIIRKNIKKAIIAAAAKRRANPEWSSNVSKAAGAARARSLALEPLQKFSCIQCGADYEIRKSIRKRGFCSMSCQGMARRASGVDDVERTCVECGAAFRTNKYYRVKCCSRRCAGIVAARARLQHHG